MGELKAFVDKFAVTSEVRHNTRGSHVTEGLMCVHWKERQSNLEYEWCGDRKSTQQILMKIGWVSFS